MDNKNMFQEAVRFFQTLPTETPGSPMYDAQFCRLLASSASADAASIWQIGADNQLHLVFSTDIPSEQAMDIILREGEGIGGAAVLSRETIFVADAQQQTGHDIRIDERFGTKTFAMISSPILFEDDLFGVLNIISHHRDKTFPPEWRERLSALAVLYAASLAKAGKLAPGPALVKTIVKGKRPPTPLSEGKTAIVGINRGMQDVLHLCLKAGHTDVPVLIYGETGTGKELAARRIHESGPKANGPFLEVNCAALTETLLESELFGHVKGAFTGATRDRQGKFAAASGGTLFLDEIGEMSLLSQAKILRALEEKKVTPLGSEKSAPADTRIIAATNKNLSEMIKEKKFREDLYYRICGIEIMIPPLRNRVEDIHLLALHFLKKAHNRRKETLRHERPLRLSQETLEALTAFDWPGNVRQLEQALLAASALCEGEEIRPDHLPAWFQKALASEKKQHTPIAAQPHLSAIETTTVHNVSPLTQEEWSRYSEVLSQTKYPGTGRWNLSAAARKLGMPRETLAYRLKKIGPRR